MNFTPFRKVFLLINQTQSNGAVALSPVLLCLVARELIIRKLVVSIRIILITEQSRVTSIVDLADPYLRGARTRPGSK